MKKFALNLSFISHPCVLTAAIVVSEIIERLSPNMAPHPTAPMQILSANPVFSLIPTAIGASAAIVPMEVPIETEIKHPIRNRPATAKCAGINDNPPAAVTAPEKPPAQRKIRLIVMMFSSPTPLAITSIFLLKLNSLFCKNATNNAIKNATIAGIA